MDASEFDRFAEEYEALHRANVRISGEEPEFFGAYKIVELERFLRERGARLPLSILDFGCGVGNSIVHLRQHFPDAEVVGVDVSGKSLDVARARFGNLAGFTHFNGCDAAVPFAPLRRGVLGLRVPSYQRSRACATALGNTAHTARARHHRDLRAQSHQPLDGSCGQDLPF
jgi:SAM-dependent methyltransferase